MRLCTDCGLSFKVWWVLVIVLEILFSGVVAVLSGWLFCFRIGSHVQFLYSPKRNENFLVKNERYEFLVCSWILVILFCLCVVRILSVFILAIGVKKKSAELTKFWMPLKGLTLIVSVFVLTASFTVGPYIKLAALIAVIGDLVTCYFTDRSD